MGDFNVNCINDFSGVTLYSQQFINMFLSHYYLKLITIPTRVTQSSASLLDNVYTTDPMSGQNGQWRSEGIWRPGANLNLAPPPPSKKFLKKS